jgi:hypothetical protein
MNMKFKFKGYLQILFVFVLLVNLNGCFYSFTGASVPVHINSISIPVFEDKSNRSEPGLRENFTSKQIQKFIDDNTLQVAEKVNADAVLESTITNFEEAPAVISGADQASQTETITQKKITVTVHVIFRDLIQKKIISDRKYTNYTVYESTGNVFANRQVAIEQVVDLITDDILIGTVSNW